MTKRLLILITAAAALAVAASKSYEVSITSPTWIGTNELKPGTYTLQVEGDQATLRMGKTVLKVPARVETGAKKHNNTALDTDNVGSKAMLRQIEVGGTPTTVVFPTGSSSAE